MTRLLVLVLFALCAVACGKAKIEQNCTMNGMGAGACSFTNTGDGEGAVCGTILVVRVDGVEGMARSNKFCSGKVGESSTTKVEFSIPDVRTVCGGGGASWNDVCEFAFLDDEELAERVRLVETGGLPGSTFQATDVLGRSRDDVRKLLGQPTSSSPTTDWWSFGDDRQVEVGVDFENGTAVALVAKASKLLTLSDTHLREWLGLPGSPPLRHGGEVYWYEVDQRHELLVAPR
jgi:hypothetical protein